MSSGKKDFYAKEVTDAIRMACETLRVPQEELAIEVVETGSMGIFGLIRKKAHIRAMVKALDLDEISPEPEPESEPESEVDKDVESVSTDAVAVAEKPQKEQEPKEPKKPKKQSKPSVPVSSAPEETAEKKETEKPKKKPKKKPSVTRKPPVEIKEESVELVRQQLEEMLKLMEFPSEVTTELDNGTVRCKVSEEHEEVLTGQDGKIVDSLQYLLRKIAARKIEEKIRLSIDIGQFREKRKVELVERAKELAALVKEDGKTQAIPPLNPSERRIVHVTLQDDKDIRSRSVGDGLFKKILIYKPGKGKKPSGSKRGGRGRRGKQSGSTKKSQENSDS